MSWPLFEISTGDSARAGPLCPPASARGRTGACVFISKLHPCGFIPVLPGDKPSPEPVSQKGTPPPRCPVWVPLPDLAN